MNTSVVKNLSDLSPAMRYALTTRNWIRRSTADALVRRGLVTLGDTRPSFGWTVHLTEAGRAARDELLAPLVPGARIRHTEHGKLGRVVRVELGENYDVVTLRWDGWNADTSGSPAYLEVIAEDEPMHWTERGRPSHSEPTAEQCDEPPMNDLEAEQDQDWRATLTGGCPNCSSPSVSARVATCVRHTDPRIAAREQAVSDAESCRSPEHFAEFPDGQDQAAIDAHVQAHLIAAEQAIHAELHPDRPCGFRWVAEIESCPRCGLSAASHDQDWPSAVTDRPAWRDELDAQVREVPLAVVRERESRSVSAHLRRARVLLTLLGAAEFAGVPDFTGADLRAYGNDVEIQLMSPEHLAPWAGLLGVDRVVVERRDTFVRVAVDATMHGIPVRCWDHLTDYRQGEQMHSWAVAHGITAQDWSGDSEFSLTVPEYLAALAATRES